MIWWLSQKLNIKETSQIGIFNFKEDSSIRDKRGEIQSYNAGNILWGFKCLQNYHFYNNYIKTIWWISTIKYSSYLSIIQPFTQFQWKSYTTISSNIFRIFGTKISTFTSTKSIPMVLDKPSIKKLIWSLKVSQILSSRIPRALQELRIAGRKEKEIYFTAKNIKNKTGIWTQLCSEISSNLYMVIQRS